MEFPTSPSQIGTNSSVPGIQRSRTGGAYFEHPKRIYWGQLTGSDAALYTAPSTLGQLYPPKVRITEIIVCNTDSSACTLTLQIRTGASAAATHIFSAVSFAANSTTVVALDTIMEAGEIISAVAGTASKLNLRISGSELLPLTVG